MQSLPVDLILRIFDTLEAADVLALATSCSYMYSLLRYHRFSTRVAYQDVFHLPYFDAFRHICCDTRTHTRRLPKYATHLEIVCRRHKLWNWWLLSTVTNLHTLEISTVNDSICYLPDTITRLKLRLARRFPNSEARLLCALPQALKTFNTNLSLLSKYDHSLWPAGLRKLRVLIDIAVDDDCCCAALMCQVPKLEISVGIYTVNMRNFLQKLQQHGNLTFFKSWYKHIDVPHVFWSQLPNLRHLQIADAYHAPNNQLHTLILQYQTYRQDMLYSLFKHLQKLTIHYTAQNQKVIPNMDFNLMPALHTLKLTGLDTLQSSHMATSRIRHLHLHFIYPQIFDTTLPHYLTKAKLQNISLPEAIQLPRTLTHLECDCYLDRVLPDLTRLSYSHKLHPHPLPSSLKHLALHVSNLDLLAQSQHKLTKLHCLEIKDAVERVIDVGEYLPPSVRKVTVWKQKALDLKKVGADTRVILERDD